MFKTHKRPRMKSTCDPGWSHKRPVWCQSVTGTPVTSDPGHIGPLVTNDPGHIGPSVTSDPGHIGPLVPGHIGPLVTNDPGHIGPSVTNGPGHIGPSVTNDPGHIGPLVTSDPGHIGPLVTNDPGHIGPLVTNDPGHIGPLVTNDPGHIGPSVTNGPGHIGPSVTNDPGHIGPLVTSDPGHIGPSVTNDPGHIGPLITNDPGHIGPSVTNDLGHIGPSVTNDPGHIGPSVTNDPGHIGPLVTNDPGHIGPSGAITKARIAREQTGPVKEKCFKQAIAEARGDRPAELVVDRTKVAVEDQPVELVVDRTKVAREDQPVELVVDRTKVAREDQPVELVVDRTKVARADQPVELVVDRTKVAREDQPVELVVDRTKVAREDQPVELVVDRTKVAREDRSGAVAFRNSAPGPELQKCGQSNLQNLSGSREHLIWGARSGAGDKCRNIWKIRMISMGKVQPTADTDSQVVTDNIGPRLDGDRVAPNATGADIGRPSRSGDQLHDSESEDETMCKNRSRQRDDNREDMSGSEDEGQERRERCRLNATREDLSRQVVPEVGFFVGEQVPIPGRILSSMSLDRLEQGTYRRLTTQCFSDGHMYTDEYVRQVPNRWSVEVCPASEEEGFRTIIDELRRSRIDDREDWTAPKVISSAERRSEPTSGEGGASTRDRFPERLIDTRELERCIERGWIEDARPHPHHSLNDVEDWRFPGAVGRAAAVPRQTIGSPHTGFPDPQPPPVTRRWGFEWCGPSSPIPGPVCTREAGWKISGRDMPDLSKCGEERTSFLHDGVVYSQPRLTEVNSIKPAEGFLFRSGLGAEPVGRNRPPPAMAWIADDRAEEYAGEHRPLSTLSDQRQRCEVVCAGHEVPPPMAYREVSRSERLRDPRRLESAEVLAEPRCGWPKATQKEYECVENRPEDCNVTQWPIERADLRCVKSDAGAASARYRRVRSMEDSRRTGESISLRLPGNDRLVTGSTVEPRLHSRRTEPDSGLRTRVWIDGDPYCFEDDPNRDARPVASDPRFRRPEPAPRLWPRTGSITEASRKRKISWRVRFYRTIRDRVVAE